MRRRISLTELLGIVGVVALGLAAMRDGSKVSLSITYAVTYCALLVGLVAAIVRARPQGAWVGFAVFGWGWYLVTYVPALHRNNPSQPLDDLVEAVVGRLHPAPVVPAALAPPPSRPTIGFGTDPVSMAMQMEMVATRGGKPVPPAVSSYLSMMRTYGTKQDNARAIARLIACLLIALAGSLVGRFLASRREPASPAP